MIKLLKFSKVLMVELLKAGLDTAKKKKIQESSDIFIYLMKIPEIYKIKDFFSLLSSKMILN